MTVELKDVIEIAENTPSFILLEVTGSRMDCIKTGILNGDEELIRVTKGGNHTLTIYKKGGGHFSYNFGINGYTILSDGEERRKKAIVDLIQTEFETSLSGTSFGTKLPQKKADIKGTKTVFKVMGEVNDIYGQCIHKNGHYYKHSPNIMAEINAKYKNVKVIDDYVSGNGCHVTVIEGTRK